MKHAKYYNLTKIINNRVWECFLALLSFGNFIMLYFQLSVQGNNAALGIPQGSHPNWNYVNFAINLIFLT